MAGMGVDGLISGLSTTDLINNLMKVEAAPQTLLKTKQTTAQTFISALQALNTRVSSLADSAKAAAKVDAFDTFKATSSSTAATATASAKAQPANLSFTVDAVAQAQTSVVDLPSSFPTNPPVITIVRNGELTTIQPASGSLADVASAVNGAADAGIKAVAIRVSNGATPEYRLQITGTQPGAENAFEVYLGDEATVQGYLDSPGSAPAGAHWVQSSAALRSAQDAQITLEGGFVLTSSSNTFTGVMTGVDVTVSKADATPVTLTVAQDTDAITKLASNLVGALGVVFSEISSRTATTTKTTDGVTTVTGGLFSGDSTVRELKQSLIGAASYPVDGRSPSEIGLNITRDGTMTFDEAKFKEALAADPAKVQSMLTGIGARVADVATSNSNSVDGTISLKIQSQESMVKDIGQRVEAWDRRLELRRETLQRTYSALEVTLSNLQSQSTWLAGQLSSLSASSS